MTEQKFEEWIEQSLIKNGYKTSFVHTESNDSKYDKGLCLFPELVIQFIKSTQEVQYNKLQSQLGESTDNQILKTIDNVIESRGLIETLRSGFSTKGCDFSLVYFKPKSSMNSEHNELYLLNEFTVVRQLHYSKKNRNSLDMVIVLNGIPIITLELKNQLTGQTIVHSERQYQNDRSSSETLFKLNRCLVHFCVDNDNVSMTTHLEDKNTKFRPYNKDIINPVVDKDYRTEYLWNDILTPDSLLDIIENYVLLTEDVTKVWSDKEKRVIEDKKPKLIFPRYHQLEVIRRLKDTIRKEGVGNNYLIQHTTGSGKSYSIGYLSHTLTSLYQHDGDTKRLFDSIVVVTDRKVLDGQLRDTIRSLQQTSGVVNHVDQTSTQLQEFIEKGKDIIITTVQKFPRISEKMSELKSKTFAVIIDEVHSSQSGESSRHLKKTLNSHDDVDEVDDDENEEFDFEDKINEDIRSRGKQPHISFFGFTGTPKNKTLELFGRKNEKGEFVPFHSYTMKQSIHEKYTLDVLQNYTTYSRYFQLRKKIDKVDVELPEGEVKKKLVNFADSHPESIKKKVEIILDHFVNTSSFEIGGKSRGMVVVRSRYHCVLFQQEMKKQMKEMGLDYSCLVGFSGTIKYGGKEHTETSLNVENGNTGSIPDGLKDPRYRILIVSNKFQTGFDEPLVQSMYVDKKLNGVQCVQTLSRLNRTTKNKDRTFVLDFVNDTEDIVNSFQPYYTETLLTSETDPDKLYDLLYKIETFKLYTKYELDEFCKDFYLSDNNSVFVHPHLDRVVDKFIKELTDEQKTEYKSLIQSFIRLYSYISQISGFGVPHWEKNYIFLRLLNRKLPKEKQEGPFEIDDVDLVRYKIQKTGDSKLTLEDTTGELDPMSSDSGGGKTEEPLELLSQIIQKVNDTFGGVFTKEETTNLVNITQKVFESDDYKKVFNGNNSDDVKKEEFVKELIEEVTDYHDKNIDFYKKVMNEKYLGLIVREVFNQLPRFLK